MNLHKMIYFSLFCRCVLYYSYIIVTKVAEYDMNKFIQRLYF